MNIQPLRVLAGVAIGCLGLPFVAFLALVVG